MGNYDSDHGWEIPDGLLTENSDAAIKQSSELQAIWGNLGKTDLSFMTAESIAKISNLTDQIIEIMSLN